LSVSLSLSILTSLSFHQTHSDLPRHIAILPQNSTYRPSHTINHASTLPKMRWTLQAAVALPALALVVPMTRATSPPPMSLEQKYGFNPDICWPSYPSEDKSRWGPFLKPRVERFRHMSTDYVDDGETGTSIRTLFHVCDNPIPSNLHHADHQQGSIKPELVARFPSDPNNCCVFTKACYDYLKPLDDRDAYLELGSEDWKKGLCCVARMRTTCPNAGHPEPDIVPAPQCANVVLG
jgi:hypothetical protein